MKPSANEIQWSRTSSFLDLKPRMPISDYLNQSLSGANGLSIIKKVNEQEAAVMRRRSIGTIGRSLNS